MKKLLVLSALFSTACLETLEEYEYEYEDTNSEEIDWDNDWLEDDASEKEVSAWISWHPDGMVLNIDDGDPNTVYYFGITQTNGAYDNNADAQQAWQWTAEDCHLGYGSMSYCHAIPSGAVSLELYSTYDVDGVTEIDDPQFTYFKQEHEPGLTYFLEDTSNEKCYVWGDLPAYYDDYDYACEYVAW